MDPDPGAPKQTDRPDPDPQDLEKYGRIFLFLETGTANITINVPLFKKMRDIILFLRDNNFLSHFKGHFEGAKTFLTP
jgi:hypothetical protein